MLSVTKIFSFDSAHFLPDYPGKCKQLHGHRWICEIEVSGEKDEKTGMIVDFSILKDKWEKVLGHLDHSCVNDMIPNPTAENIIEYVVSELRQSLLGAISLVRVRLYETPTSFAEWKIT